MKFSAHSPYAIRSLIEHRLSEERLLIPLRSEAELMVPLCYPSPYHVGMSSLGFQVVYRLLNSPDYPRLRVERAFLPDDVDAWRRARLPLLTYESQSAVGRAPAILFSVAYELELTGLFSCLELSSVPLLQSERGAGQPLIICGGPLTFSNPLPLGPFADIVVMGEAEEVLPRLMRYLIDAGLGSGQLLGTTERQALLQALSGREGLWIPSVDGERLPKVAACDNSLLPATSTFITPNTELKSMFLIEPERGCSRGCTYCVMRRSTNGGMRMVTPEKVASLIPADVTRVGLVGAAVTDHPKLPDMLRHIVEERGLQVGISSLRADRLTDELVGLLGRGGYRTLTVASDGASERLRVFIERRTKERHLLRSAELAAAHGMKTLKVYMIVGLPTETEDDIDELVRFGIELSKIVRTSFGVAPFVAKRNTPLDRTPFAGIAEVERRLARLRQGVGKHVEVRPTSARWAWVEYVLAQGGMEGGHRALAAHQAGGSFAAWRRAFEGWQPLAPQVLPGADSAVVHITPAGSGVDGCVMPKPRRVCSCRSLPGVTMGTRSQPIYMLSQELLFPPVEWARPDGLLAAYGDLSVERLLLSYQSGIFPWYSAGSPILWWAPPERAVSPPGELHIGRSLRKVMRRGEYQVRFDTNFRAVITACATTPRRHESGTWIVPEIVNAYTRLHQAGFAHSVETYKDDVLVGGLYGVSLGGCFFGESMFSRADDASKVAFVTLAERLVAWDFDLIDGQLQNDHLDRFGLVMIPRAEFMRRLALSLARPTRRGPWT